MVPVLENRLDYLRNRRTVIDSNEGLRELELRKLANLSASIASGFQARGLGDLHATLAADAG